MAQAAIGFRVKSGRATAVLVEGSSAEPKVIDCRIVPLADPAVPESSQPYHAALDLPKFEADRTLARLIKVVERVAIASVTELIEAYRKGGHRPSGAALVVGSETDPATIKNDHIRAHAEEGRLFRVVIEDAVHRCGLKSSVMVEKDLFAGAARTLRIPEGRLKGRLTALGRGLGGRWRLEEKSAALAAWLILE